MRRLEHQMRAYRHYVLSESGGRIAVQSYGVAAPHRGEYDSIQEAKEAIDRLFPPRFYVREELNAKPRRELAEIVSDLNDLIEGGGWVDERAVRDIIKYALVNMIIGLQVLARQDLMGRGLLAAPVAGCRPA